MKKLIKRGLTVLALTTLVSSTFITKTFAMDHALYSEKADYYYIVDDNFTGARLKFNSDGVLDEADAYAKLGKNYKDDMDTWNNMKLYNYGNTLNEHNIAKAKVSEVAASLNSGSDYDKFKKIYDYIYSTTSYDFQASIERNSFTIYGCLINHSAVCEGIAKAYQAIAMEMGLPCYLRYSEADDHGWNAIQLDGEWYVCDATRGSFAEDPSNWTMNYNAENSGAYNGNVALTAITQYVPLNYSTHGYGSSSTPTPAHVDNIVSEQSNQSYTENNTSVPENTDSSSVSAVPEESNELSENSENNESASAEDSTSENSTETTEKAIGTNIAVAENKVSDEKPVTNAENNEVKEKTSAWQAILMGVVIAFIILASLFIIVVINAFFRVKRRRDMEIFKK